MILAKAGRAFSYALNSDINRAERRWFNILREAHRSGWKHTHDTSRVRKLSIKGSYRREHQSSESCSQTFTSTTVDVHDEVQHLLQLLFLKRSDTRHRCDGHCAIHRRQCLVRENAIWYWKLPAAACIIICFSSSRTTGVTRFSCGNSSQWVLEAVWVGIKSTRTADTISETDPGHPK